MFFGTVPNECIEQILRVVPFHEWNDCYTCCSGTFKIEQAIRSRNPELKIHANDVSLYSCALGRYLTNDPIRITFHSRLQFIEDYLGKDAPFEMRVAAVLVAQERFVRYKGDNSYCRKVWDYSIELLPDLLAKAQAKLVERAAKTQLSSFFAGDWRTHIEHAAKKGAGVCAFPPFYKGGYESQYKFLEENTDWEKAPYDLYNPKELESVLDRLDVLGVDYCILSDQIFENRRPMLEFVSGRLVPHYCYSNRSRSTIRHLSNKPEPFLYKPIDTSKLTRKTKVKVIQAEARHLNFIKDVYLAKGITHSTGMWNYFVFLDDMLAGGVIYTTSSFGVNTASGESYSASQCIRLLSDVTLSNENKLSKLISMIATSMSLIKPLQNRRLDHIEYITTTAFTNRPMSMKYRGIYELNSRRPSDDPLDGYDYVLQYGSNTNELQPHQLYRIWFDKYSGLKHKTRNNDKLLGSRQDKTSNKKRSVHDRATTKKTRR